MERQGLRVAQTRNEPAASSSRARTARESSLRPPTSNHAMQQLLQSGKIQPKLTISQPGDELEQEADRIAETVGGGGMAITANDKPIGGGAPAPSVQRMCTECEEEELQRKERGPITETAPPEADINRLQHGGEPLSEAARAYFEPRFGRDFSDVRIHTGAAASQAADSINALAYTRDRNIVFGDGQYQPHTTAGQRLLAHELAHVVQQSGGATGLARSPQADLVQRACGNTAIGTPAGCTPDTSDPVGDLILFRFDCDEFSPATEEQRVIDFADSMTADDRVAVHGFASIDGDAAYNHRLSCARALRVVDVLTAHGIAASQIDTFEHGGTAGPAVTRRSVVLSRDPAVSRPSVPQLTANIQTGPNAGNCGSELFVIRWSLSRNSDATDGGFVIQDVTFNWNVTDCTGAAIPTPPFTSPLHYFEAWRVPAGTNTPNATAFTVNTDQFFWPNAAPWAGPCSDGTVTITATARYHDGVAVASLPAHMTPFNASTFANDLPASLTDPALAGNVSRPVAHSLRFHWNCCPCSSSPTIVDSHVP